MSLSTVVIEASYLHGTYSKTEIHNLIQISSLESIRQFIQNNLHFLSRNQDADYSNSPFTQQRAESTAMSIVNNALGKKWHEYKNWFEQNIKHQEDQYGYSFTINLVSKAAQGPDDFKV